MNIDYNNGNYDRAAEAAAQEAFAAELFRLADQLKAQQEAK